MPTETELRDLKAVASDATKPLDERLKAFLEWARSTIGFDQLARVLIDTTMADAFEMLEQAANIKELDPEMSKAIHKHLDSVYGKIRIAEQPVLAAKVLLLLEKYRN